MFERKSLHAPSNLHISGSTHPYRYSSPAQLHVSLSYLSLQVSINQREKLPRIILDMSIAHKASSPFPHHNKIVL